MAITQDEIQTMFKNVVDLLEKHRVYGDATATVDGELDVLTRSLEGEYAPAVASAAEGFRSLLSSPINVSVARSMLDPLVFEYGKFISENADNLTGGGAGDLAASDRIDDVMRAIYEHMVETSETVESRVITYDTTAVKSNLHETSDAIVGNGAVQRLTVDAEAFSLEACAIERKVFRCVRDQTTGAKEEAEIFDVWGEAPPRDEFGRNKAGVTGQLGNGYLGQIRSLNAGSGTGGSLLKNSSFSTFTASASSGEQFSGWEETLSGTGADTTDLTQSTTVYRSFHGDSSNRSLQIVSPGGSTANYILSQPLSKMRIASLNFGQPYFLRLMYKGDGVLDGTLKLRLGSTEDTVVPSGTDWNELMITADADTWPANFNEDDFRVDIEFDDGATGGTLLIDDVILAPYTEIDGTFWAIRGNATSHTPWKHGDTLIFTDTGGAPATAEIQYWLYRTGLGYLPHTTGTPTWTEPA